MPLLQNRRKQTLIKLYVSFFPIFVYGTTANATPKFLREKKIIFSATKRTVYKIKYLKKKIIPLRSNEGETQSGTRKKKIQLLLKLLWALPWFLRRLLPGDRYEILFNLLVVKCNCKLSLLRSLYPGHRLQIIFNLLLA